MVCSRWGTSLSPSPLHTCAWQTMMPTEPLLEALPPPPGSICPCLPPSSDGAQLTTSVQCCTHSLSQPPTSSQPWMDQSQPFQASIWCTWKIPHKGSWEALSGPWLWLLACKAMLLGLLAEKDSALTFLQLCTAGDSRSWTMVLVHCRNTMPGQSVPGCFPFCVFQNCSLPSWPLHCWVHSALWTFSCWFFCFCWFFHKALGVLSMCAAFTVPHILTLLYLYDLVSPCIPACSSAPPPSWAQS